MSEVNADPFPDVVRWLAAHAGFPARRLDARAETAVCVAVLAHAGDLEAQGRHELERTRPGQAAALKTHALRRSRVHFKSDNSAKV